MTIHAQPRFTVKEHASGEPWIAIEYSKAAHVLPPGQVGFDLPKGTTLAEAKEIAKYMQSKLTGLSYLP